MPTVIDELAMTLSLDPSKFEEGAKQAESASQSMAQKILNTLNQIEQETARHEANAAERAKQTATQQEEHLRRHVEKNREASRAIAEEFSKVGDAIKRAGIELLAFMGIEMTVHGMERMFTDISKANAEIGYMATGLGTSTRVLTEFQMAAKGVGATVEDMSQIFASVQTDAQNLAHKSVTTWGPVLQHLLNIDFQKAPGVAKSAEELIPEIIKRLDQRAKAEGWSAERRAGEAAFVAQELHLGPGAARIFGAGTEQWNEARKQAARIGGTPEEAAKASQEMLTSFGRIKDTIGTIGEAITTELSPKITKISNQIYEWLLANRGWIEEYIIGGLKAVGAFLEGFYQDIVKAFNSQPMRVMGSGIRAVASAIDDAVKATVGWKAAIEGIILLVGGVAFVGMLRRLSRIPRWLAGGGGAPAAAAEDAGIGLGARFLPWLFSPAAPIVAAGGAAIGVSVLNTKAQEETYRRAEKMGYEIRNRGSSTPTFAKGGKEIDWNEMQQREGFGPQGFSFAQSFGFNMPPEPGTAEATATELKRIKEVAEQELKIQEEQLKLQRERAAKEELTPHPGLQGGASGGEAAPLGERFDPPSNLRLPVDQLSRAAIVRDRAALDLNLPTEASTGIVANALGESGLRGIPEEGGGSGRGWIQWSGDRAKQFMAYAKERNLDWRSDEANYGFMIQELKSPKYADLLRRLRALKGQPDAASKATQMIQDEYEKPGIPRTGVRQGYSRQLDAIPPAQGGSFAPAPTTGELGNGSVIQVRPPVGWQKDSLNNMFLPEYSLGAGNAASRQFASASSVDQSRSSQTSIGNVTVVTQATDADGIARDIKGALKKYDYAVHADTGLA